ncbi:MAG: phospho-N-acetylmuramoyl-pentapeptide-transferase [Lachnospiraceae bacterium]
MKEHVIGAVLISFAISALLGPMVIPFLHKLKFGQNIREEGPKGHQKKAGTPTMGGVMFLLSIMVTALFYLDEYAEMAPVLFVTVGFGVVGFLDDFIKIIKKRSEGLTPIQKLLAQLVVACIFAVYCYMKLGSSIIIPFTGGYELDLKILYIPFCIFVLLGTDNGANLTDGLDGLCASVTVMISTFFAVAALGCNSGIGPVCGAVTGSLMGFLLFNVYPAKVFMGDTGSLALGGFVAASAFMLKNPLIIVLVGFIYLVEALSVIIQVTYFKKTGGKRIFRMAPIHHHFELGGWSETRVVAVFSIITALLCLVAYMAL